jgi:ElaB/YqjD/DUF883 family membrane-anchored ribosome-binding protein
MSQIRSTSRNGEVNANPVSLAADNLETMAHETIDRAAKTANATVHEVRDAAARAAGTATRARDQAIQAAGESVQTIRSYAERNPFTTAGIALALGAVLIALVRR